MATVIRQLNGKKDPSYEFLGALGQGGFGSVAKVRRLSDGKIMACKAIDCSSQPLFVDLANREIQTWSSFASSEKYIAEFGHDVTWAEETKTIRLYMKLYEGGDLQRVITECRHQDSTVHPFIATYWAMEIARGLKACHDRGIIHRDLKPANVLLEMPYLYNNMLWRLSEGRLSAEENERELAKRLSTWLESRSPWCHISDFGYGKFTSAAYLSGHHSNGSLGTVGTVGYLAPEVLQYEPKFSVKSDVYGFGCLVYSLCTSKPPPPIAQQEEPAPEIPEAFPKRLRKIISRCMKFHPEQRPNSRELANEVADAFIDIQNDYIYGDIKRKLACAANQLSQLTYIAMLVQTRDTRPQDTESNEYRLLSQRELDTLLRQAMAAEDYRLMGMLIDVGANVNAHVFDEPTHLEQDPWTGVHPFINKAIPFAKTVCRFINKREVEFPLVTAAAFNGSRECVDTLFANGARRMAGEMGSEPVQHVDPLTIAACYGFTEIINTLVLRWGFNVNGPMPITTESFWGATPLSVAAQFGSHVGVARLLALGASARIPGSNGNFPLHSVFLMDDISARNIERCAQMIYQAAPDLINSQNDAGFTPLHLAVQKSFTRGPRFVKLLIGLGADPHIQNSTGHDAFNIRDSQTQLVIASYLPEVKKALDAFIYNRYPKVPTP